MILVSFHLSLVRFKNKSCKPHMMTPRLGISFFKDVQESPTAALLAKSTLLRLQVRGSL